MKLIRIICSYCTDKERILKDLYTIIESVTLAFIFAAIHKTICNYYTFDKGFYAVACILAVVIAIVLFLSKQRKISFVIFVISCASLVGQWINHIIIENDILYIGIFLATYCIIYNSKMHVHLEDRPQKDLLNRQYWINHITEILITRFKTQKYDNKIAIKGAWGSGKTFLMDSIVNELKNKVAQLKDDKIEVSVIVAKIKAWSLESLSEEEMWRVIIKSIADARLNSKPPFLFSFILKSKIYSYLVKILPNSMAPFFSSTNYIISNTYNYDSLDEDAFAYLNKLLEEEKINIVLMIDDIDRCSSSTIRSIFCLLDELRKLKRVAIMCAYDPSKICKQETIDSSQCLSAGWFEKIFDLQFEIPELTGDNKRNFIINYPEFCNDWDRQPRLKSIIDAKPEFLPTSLRKSIKLIRIARTMEEVYLSKMEFEFSNDFSSYSYPSNPDIFLIFLFIFIESEDKEILKKLQDQHLKEKGWLKRLFEPIYNEGSLSDNGNKIEPAIVHKVEEELKQILNFEDDVYILNLLCSVCYRIRTISDDLYISNALNYYLHEDYKSDIYVTVADRVLIIGKLLECSNPSGISDILLSSNKSYLKYDTSATIVFQDLINFILSDSINAYLEDDVSRYEILQRILSLNVNHKTFNLQYDEQIFITTETLASALDYVLNAELDKNKKISIVKLLIKNTNILECAPIQDTVFGITIPLNLKNDRVFEDSIKGKLSLIFHYISNNTYSEFLDQLTTNEISEVMNEFYKLIYESFHNQGHVDIFNYRRHYSEYIKIFAYNNLPSHYLSEIVPTEAYNSNLVHTYLSLHNTILSLYRSAPETPFQENIELIYKDAILKLLEVLDIEKIQSSCFDVEMFGTHQRILNLWNEITLSNELQKHFEKFTEDLRPHFIAIGDHIKKHQPVPVDVIKLKVSKI